MKTKALISLVIFGACAVRAMAETNIYSDNVVGLYKVVCPANQYQLLANQLHTTNDVLSTVIPNAPPNSILQKFNAGYTAYSFDDVDLAWVPDGNVSLKPGEGGFFKSPVTTTLTFVGEVMQGSLTNTLPRGQYAIRASIVPQNGRVTTDLGLPAEPNDILQNYTLGYTAYSFDDVDLVWVPFEPSNTVGRAFWYVKALSNTHTNWIRNFTVQ